MYHVTTGWLEDAAYLEARLVEAERWLLARMCQRRLAFESFERDPDPDGVYERDAWIELDLE